MRSLLFIFAVGFVESAFATAACCGGVSTLARPLLGSERLQLTVSGFRSEALAYMTDHGQRRAWTPEPVMATQMRAVTSLGPRYQLGAQTSLLTPDSGSPLLGDSELGVYREISDWFPSSRSRPFLHMLLNLPSGQAAVADPMSGFPGGTWQAGVGLSLSRTWAEWDFEFVSQLRHIWTPESSPGFEFIERHNQVALNAFTGVGWSPGQGDWRIGLGALGVTRRALSSSGGEVAVALGPVLSLDYRWDDSVSVSGRYQDSGFLPLARNAVLSRSFILGVSFRPF